VFIDLRYKRVRFRTNLFLGSFPRTRKTLYGPLVFQIKNLIIRNGQENDTNDLPRDSDG
jgi:hypothetical protein